jgi:hypothetical protein
LLPLNGTHGRDSRRFISGTQEKRRETFQKYLVKVSVDISMAN